MPELDAEDFDLARLPGNPAINQTVQEHLTALRKLVTEIKYPDGTEFECKRCGSCCTWFFMFLVVDEELNVELRKRVKYPHGSWIMEGDQISLQMPGYAFTGNIPVDQAEYMTKAGRHWGYWVLNAAGKVAVYNPTPCIHLVDGKCAIYEDRPSICKKYFCRRYPIIV